MAHLVDTSVLARLANTADPFHLVAARAVLELHRRGELLHVAPQNLVEFRNLATRPNSANGLGLSAVAVDAKAAVFEATFPLLAETPDIYTTWKALVSRLGIIGKQVHDARLVAVCHVHAVTHLLTFNTNHFSRMAGFGPGVVPAALSRCICR
jgi:predicted nucleic acid-binding protein